MKRAYDIFLGVLITALIFASFSAGRVSAASSGCFTDTNGHWAETFICWLKDSGISYGYADGSYHPDNSITRGEMAVMLKKVNDVAKGYSDSNLTTAKAYTDSSLIAAKEYTDSSLNGEVQITLSPMEWENDDPSFFNWVQVDHSDPMETSVTSSQTGYADFRATTPILPTSIYGRTLALSKVEICYTEAHLFAPITRIMVQLTDSYNLTSPTDDTTTRITADCAVYTYTPVIPLHEGDYLSFLVRISWGLTELPIKLGRVVIYLQPQ